MSDEGGVMPSEVVLDTILGEITDQAKHLWTPGGPWLVPDTVAGITESLKTGLVPQCKPWLRGVDTGQRLSLLNHGKAVGGQARVRTGLGKSDRPGS